ncbi:acyltransferase [Pseudomonas sp.]|uniref:acyltransferase n=1 Tax=Pseudomonas sp. TaxID=306 RepID=UPI0028A712F7|nr:acyltransferase family protein [Pseudomonas sp.]
MNAQQQSQPAETPVFLATHGTPRDTSLDALRLVATLMVVMIHVSAAGFAELAPHWWAVNAYESLSRASVPIFFMITGALLLPRTHTIKSTTRRALRMITALLAWSIIFLVYNKYKITGMLLPDLSELGHWLAAIVRWPVAPHLWYLYTLIAGYFFIPVLTGFFRTTALSLQCVVLAVWFLAASVVPFMERYFNAAYLYMDMRFFYIYPAYMLAGAMLYHHVRMASVRALAGIGMYLVCCAGTAFLTWFFSKDATTNTELYYEYYAPLVVISALCIFHALRHFSLWLTQRWPGTSQPIIFGGSLTFGVYLMHPMLIWELQHHGFGWNFINPWLAIPLLVVVVFVACGALTWVLQRTPVLRLLIPG